MNNGIYLQKVSATIKCMITFISLFSLWFTQPVVETPPERQKMTLDESITFYADKYHVSSVVMSKLIFCESSNDVNAKHISSKEESYGLAQINTKVHDVTIEQATDQDFAVEFMAKNIAKGKASQMWVVCWNKINE